MHPPEHKELTATLPIEEAPLPRRVILPLSQHIGAPARPVVKVGEEVRTGQVIAEAAEAPVSVPVHASIAGRVAAIAPFPHPAGRELPAIVIEGTGEDRWIEEATSRDPERLSPEEIRRLAKEAGLVGLGGAAFPTHIKLSPPPDKPIDTVIINGCECEPYLTCDHRLMVEETEAILDGLRAIMKAVGAARAWVAVEDNKPDAIARLQEAVRGRDGVAVAVLPSRYPQGAEKQLIAALTGRQVPSGGLPMDVGVLVQNVGTAAALSAAIRRGRPLVERVITVTGRGVQRPANLRVRLGTPVRDLIEFCGGFAEAPARVVLGGPMMGVAVADLGVPVVKGTSGILVLTEGELPAVRNAPCVRCGRCVCVCPMGLLPLYLGRAAEHRRWEEAEAYHALDCIECGSCSYVCPGERPLVQYIRQAKAEIMARRAKGKKG